MRRGGKAEDGGAEQRSKLISSCGNDSPYFPVSFSRRSRAKAMSQHVVTRGARLRRTEVRTSAHDALLFAISEVEVLLSRSW